MASIPNGVHGQVDYNAPTAQLFTSGASGTITLTNAMFTNASSLSFMIAYRAGA